MRCDVLRFALFPMILVLLSACGDGYLRIDYVSDDVVTGPVDCYLRPADIRIGRFAPGSDSMIQLSGTVAASLTVAVLYFIWS